jgi:hypothetical protein
MAMRKLFLIALVAACSNNNKGGTTGGTAGTGGTTAGTTTAGTTGGTGGNDLAGCAVTDTCGTDDAGMGCGLNTCASQGATCGPIGDGCGGMLDCGGCPMGQSCGAGGVNFQCGAVSGCMPRKCADVGAECGPIGDNCGGLIATCGTCPTGSVCGGGGMPSKCSAVMSMNDMSVDCGRFCGMFGNCTGATTTISGTVVAGTDPTRGFGQPDPIFNASVYIPTTTVQPFGTTVTCDQCGAAVSGTPLMTVNTGIDGKFTLANVPCGTGINLPIVIQLGRWRRQIVIPDVACCAPLMLTTDQTHLPRNHNEGDIPQIALSTGNVDALECVLRKMGIEDAEFTRNTATPSGRVHIYHGNGADAGTNTNGENTLVDSPTLLANYDMVLFPCWGGQNQKTLARQQNMIAYGDKGGRVFATHFSYTWLATVGTVTTPMDGVPMGTPPSPQPWVGTANFNVNLATYGTNSMTGLIDQTFPKGMALASWLAQPAVGASTTPGQMPIAVVRRDTDSVVPPSQRWLYTMAPDPDVPVVHYTFNTPVGVTADKQCGRVVFSDFHVENTSNANGKHFPAECGTAAPMTPQEKLLEFMLFDLASCVTPDSAPITCMPQTCMQIGAECGPQADGCGGIVPCGDCPPGQTCGAGGPNKCGATPCTPRTCAGIGANCGIIGDGCGGTVNCGDCPPTQACGGGGVANVCAGVG